MKPEPLHAFGTGDWNCDRKVDVRLPGKGNSNSHGARPVHLTIMMIKWIRTSRSSIKNSLSGTANRKRLSRSRLQHGQSFEC